MSEGTVGTTELRGKPLLHASVLAYLNLSRGGDAIKYVVV